MLLLRILLTLAALHLDPEVPVQRAWESVGLCVEEAAGAGVDPALVVAVGHFESKLDPAAVSRYGYVGILQTASRAPGWRHDRPTVRWYQDHPRAAVSAGAVELAAALVRCNGEEACALCMYHEGPRDSCVRRRTKYAEGVLWEREFLRRAVTGDPVGELTCQVQMTPDLDPPRVVAAQACVPVFGVGHGGLPRSSQKSILDRLRASTLDRLRFDACAQEFGAETTGYWRCIHAGGRRASCELALF